VLVVEVEVLVVLLPDGFAPPELGVV